MVVYDLVSQAFSDIGETCIELVFESLDRFIVQLFHTAAIFGCYMYLLFETT